MCNGYRVAADIENASYGLSDAPDEWFEQTDRTYVLSQEHGTDIFEGD